MKNNIYKLKKTILFLTLLLIITLILIIPVKKQKIYLQANPSALP